MRKALIGLIVAATALTPAAALAQRGNRGGAEQNAEQRVQRMQQRNEAREQRQEARQQRQEARQQPAPQQQAQRQERRAQRQQQVVQRQQQVAQRDRGGDRQGRGDRRPDRPARQPSIYPDAWQGNPNDPRLRNYQRLERQNRQQGRQDRREDRREWRQDRREDRRDWRQDRRQDRREWNRNWRNDRRYDWRSWRNSNRHIFRGSRYYSPYRNYGYNRFSIGIFLEPLFYSNRYWIGDPWQYRLPPAYPGTQWVRYYNDVLLVDVYTGEVLDVIHDFFW